MDKRFAKSLKIAIGAVIAGGLAAAGFWFWIEAETQPKGIGPKQYVRFEKAQAWPIVANQLQAKGLIKNAQAATWFAKLSRKNFIVSHGTYHLAPSDSILEIMKQLQSPIVNMFRIPETNLSYRTANLLEKNNIAAADDYKSLLKDPEKFQAKVSFPLPKDSLEGYLYPDTYDLPPLMGAENVIDRQLKAFEKRVLPLLPKPEKHRAILTIASMVELEAGRDEERAKIAGVIYNRINKNMRLEIDATVLYGLGEWRRLYYKDYQNTNSPYNTYKIKGLPPGPIASPTVKSVVAALNPEKHGYLYYVALPTRFHLFARSYPEHLRNIQIARKARAAATPAGTSSTTQASNP